MKEIEQKPILNDGVARTKIYAGKCVKKTCGNQVVLHPSVADGYYVGNCGLCGTKVIEKV